MTTKEIIKAWKINEKPFDFLGKQMRAFAVTIGKNGHFSCWDERGWTKLNDETDTFKFNPIYVYRLRPDYEEKPENVELPIKESDAGNICYYSENYETCYGVITNAPSKPDFNGFKYDGQWISFSPRLTTGEVPYGSSYNLAAGVPKILTPTHVLFRKAE